MNIKIAIIQAVEAFSIYWLTLFVLSCLWYYATRDKKHLLWNETKVQQLKYLRFSLFWFCIVIIINLTK